MALDLEPLLEAFPHWRPLVVEEASEHGPYLVLQVAAPEAAKTEHGLLVHTDNDEITVSFDYYHAHFDAWYDWDGKHTVDSALEFIHRLVDEEVSVVSWWWNDQWRGSAQLENPSKPEPPSWANPGSWNRVRVRSWNGTFSGDSAA